MLERHWTTWKAFFHIHADISFKSDLVRLNISTRSETRDFGAPSSLVLADCDLEELLSNDSIPYPKNPSKLRDDWTHTGRSKAKLAYIPEAEGKGDTFIYTEYHGANSLVTA